MKGIKIMKKGIDISYCQPNIDLSHWKNNEVTFVLVRAGVSTRKDTMFDSHLSQILKNKIPYGVYWWCKATTTQQAVKEAETLLNVIDGLDFEYPVFYDIEDQILINLGKDQLTEVIKAFVKTVNFNSNHDVGVYINPSFMEQYVNKSDVIGKMPIWLAHWTGEGVLSKYQYGQMFQQFGLTKYDNLEVAGDYLLLENDPATENLRNLPTYSVANLVLDDVFGAGVTRKQKLEQYGYNYGKVQNAVNDIKFNRTKTLTIPQMLPDDFKTISEAAQKLGYKIV